MSWSASQVFAQPNPDVLEALRALPGLHGAIYHVPDLNEMETVEYVVDGVVFDEGETELDRPVRRGPRERTRGRVAAYIFWRPTERL